MAYDPFDRGQFPVGVRTVYAVDTTRERPFPCEIWYPAAAHDTVAEIRDATARPGSYPLIAYSHQSGGHRRTATFLCTHLASHGYQVGAMDHSDVVAPELGPRAGETDEQRTARANAWIANRVPDIRFLLDHLTADHPTDRIGIVGHSFGGWTALAVPEVDERIRAVVAHAPAGNSRPLPGVIPAKLTFAWSGEVPTLYLAAEHDTPVPLAGVYELVERTPGASRLMILRNADHQHFVDEAESTHETWRTTPDTGPAAWMQARMRPFAQLCPAELAQMFVRGLTLAHLDATLRRNDDARRFLDGDDGDLRAALAARGVDAVVREPTSDHGT